MLSNKTISRKSINHSKSRNFIQNTMLITYKEFEKRLFFVGFLEQIKRLRIKKSEKETNIKKESIALFSACILYRKHSA